MRSLILAIVFELTLVFGYGQTLSLEIGPSVSSLTWDDSKSTDVVYNSPVIGLNARLGLGYLDYKYFNLYSSLGFVQKGGKGSLLGTSMIGPEGVAETDVTSILNYITVNTLFIGKLPLGTLVTPFLRAGPRLDYLLSYHETFSIIGQCDEYKELNNTIYGLDLGAGVDFNLGNLKLGFVCDYLLNFNKLVDFTTVPDNRYQIYDNTFTLNAKIGYRFQ